MGVEKHGRGVAAINFTPPALNLGGAKPALVSIPRLPGQFHWCHCECRISVRASSGSCRRNVCRDHRRSPPGMVSHIDTAGYRHRAASGMGTFASRGTHRVGNAVLQVQPGSPPGLMLEGGGRKETGGLNASGTSKTEAKANISTSRAHRKSFDFQYLNHRPLRHFQTGPVESAVACSLGSASYPGQLKQGAMEGLATWLTRMPALWPMFEGPMTKTGEVHRAIGEKKMSMNGRPVETPGKMVGSKQNWLGGLFSLGMGHQKPFFAHCLIENPPTEPFNL